MIRDVPKNTPIVLFGGAGFIGRNLTLKFLREGFTNIIVLDNYMTSVRDTKLAREFELTGKVTERYCDIVDKDFMNAIDIAFYLKDAIIYNLACPASPVWYQASPLKTFETSIYGMHNILDRLCGYNNTIVFTSTSEVYGDPLVHPQDENYYGNVNVLGPRSCYDEGKRAAETLCKLYQKPGRDIRIARLFNTYGPHMAANDGRVVSNFICAALAGRDITIYGDGSQTRSFCYVDDTVDALYTMGLSDDVEPVQPINIGNPVEFTIKELAETVLSLVGGTSKIVYADSPYDRLDDPRQRKPVIARANDLLNWSPTTPLNKGLQETIRYFSDLK